MDRQIAGRLTSPVTKWLVLAAWIVLFMVGSALNNKLTSVQNNEASSWLPGSAESTKVVEELENTINPNDIPTLVVYYRDGGLTESDFAAIEEHAKEIAQIDGVTEEGVLTPGTASQVPNLPFELVSGDDEVAISSFVFNFGKDGWNDIPPAADDVRDIARIDGVEVHLAGFGGQAADSAEAFEGIDTTLIAITLLVVIVILLLTYRSAVLWILPIMSVVVSAAVSGGVVYLLAKYSGLTVNGQSQAILSILVIGAGTDYALLLVARYREELRRHEDRHKAMAVALHRAAPAILASAATVVVGMLCLAVADLNSTAGMGPVLAVGIAVTFLVMVTLLPALLVIFGRWVFGPREENHRTWVITGASMIGGGIVAAVLGALVAGVGGFLGGVGAFVLVLAVLAAVIGVLVLIQVAIEHWTRVHSRPDFGSREPNTTGFWARLGNRIAPRPRGVWVVTALVLGAFCLGLFKLDASGLSTEDTYTKEFDSIKGQKILVEHGLQDNSNTAQIVTNADQQKAVIEATEGLDGLGPASDPQPISDQRVYFERTIGEDISSTAAFDIVEETRDRAHGVEGADALVGGGSAFYLDTKIASSRDNRVIIPLVLVVVFIILILLLRALVAPLLLIGTVILSFGAALGISALLFEYVFGFAGTDPGFPLFAFVFLVALGIDYNIFLMTRVREESISHGTRRGSLIALASTGGVITSAGIVLAATFLVLGSIPFVFLAELGITVALGVLLDTMIVRSVLVTALNLDLGSKIWWPSKLDRGDNAAEPPTATETREPVTV